MAATLPATQHISQDQLCSSMLDHLRRDYNVEIELSSGCTFRLWTQEHSRRVSAKISVPNYFTTGPTECYVDPATVEQLNTLLVLTYGTKLVLAQTGSHAQVEFQYILFATDNRFDKFVDAATFVKKVLDNLPGNVVQLTSTKEKNTFDVYNDYY